MSEPFQLNEVHAPGFYGTYLVGSLPLGAFIPFQLVAARHKLQKERVREKVLNPGNPQ